MKPKYQRIMLKFSGEELAGQHKFGIDYKLIRYIGEEVSKVLKLNVQVGIVIGGGNIYRGAALTNDGLDRVTGDYMGMLATLMNALAIRDIFEQMSIDTAIMSSLAVTGVMDHYDRRKAIKHLSEGRVVVFAGGTGNPLFTTDSALSLRGIELNADLLLKATNVDGIYAEDPFHNPHAKLFKKLTYKEVILKELRVMDMAAFSQCKDYHMKLRVYNMHKVGALHNIIVGGDDGTLVGV